MYYDLWVKKEIPRHQTYPLTAIKKGGGFGAGLLFVVNRFALGQTIKKSRGYLDLNIKPRQITGQFFVYASLEQAYYVFL